MKSLLRRRIDPARRRNTWQTKRLEFPDRPEALRSWGRQCSLLMFKSERKWPGVLGKISDLDH